MEYHWKHNFLIWENIVHVNLKMFSEKYEQMYYAYVYIY